MNVLPILKETTERGVVCSKTTNPLKGVGGSIIQSLELKRHVSQKPTGKVKVFERAIEEYQSTSGSSTVRRGTKVYYFDNNDDRAFDAKLDSINQELDEKCDEMEMIDMLLAENELRLAKLDAELAKFSGLDEKAVEGPITDDKHKKVLNISSDDGEWSQQSKTGSLNCELDQFCKDILKKHECDNDKQNLQNLRLQLPSDRKAISETENKQHFRNRSKSRSPERRSHSQQKRNQPACLRDNGKEKSLNDECGQNCNNTPLSSCSPPPQNDFREPRYKKRASTSPLCDNINIDKNDERNDLPQKQLPEEFDQCLAECEKLINELTAPKCSVKQQNLFSRIVDGERCFPDISEIAINDHKLYLAERDAYLLFRQKFADQGNDNTFFERPNQFKEFFFNYLNGPSKINISTCPQKNDDKTPLENLVQSFVNIHKIELEPFMQRNVEDLALDRPDQDPEVIALLMNEQLPIWADPLFMSDLVMPYTLQKRLFGTDVRHSAPGSIVPQTIPVHDLNVINLHVLDNVEAIIKSNEYLYPKDCHATDAIKDVIITKPEKEEQTKECESDVNYKCLLDLQPFRVETFFQLRGANLPLWYPGMFTAFPDGKSLVKLVRTPSTLITTAWNLCAP